MMKKTVSVKAFGKILVFGAYAILEKGNLGLVVNVDKGTKVSVSEKSEGISVMIPHLSLEAEGGFTGKNGSFEFNSGDVRLSFLAYAISYTAEHLRSKNIKIKGMSILSENDPELYGYNDKKTGLGSSSSSTVAAVAAILLFHGIDDRDLVYKISCFSHRLSQGRLGSGYDVFSACYGSHYFTGSKQNLDEHFLQCLTQDWNISRDKFTWPESWIPLIINTGKSASTTKMIEKILHYRKNNKKEYSLLMKKYDIINRKIKKELDEGHFEKAIPLIEVSWRYRKELGKSAGIKIEDESTEKILNEMKRNGAITAGLVGAGGGDSILAICKNEKDKMALLRFAEKTGMRILDAEITDKGYVLF